MITQTEPTTTEQPNRMATEVKECTVCCEAYNKTTHQQILCEHAGVCAFEACKTCVRKYLLSTTNDPCCMQCNKAWSDKFLITQLKASFMRGDYKLHRKELLLQQQLSRLPETMAAAEQHKQLLALQTQLFDLDSQYNLAAMNEKAIRSARGKEYGAAKRAYDGAVEAAEATRLLIRDTMHKLRHDMNVVRNGGATKEEEKEVRKFIMPCGNADCRGYLSTKYKCELCDHHTCAKCFEHIGISKEEGSHECKQENIESAEFIRKQSKPCPCCGTRISKIDGCDQMWCTQCHKAFSWNTGKIITGTVHNPHFYQYQREQGGGVAPRNPGDVVCGVLPTLYELNHKIAADAAALPKSHQDFFYNTVMQIHRLQMHFTDTYINPIRATLHGMENRNECHRISYILQSITKEKLATLVVQLDEKRKKDTAILHVCDLFTTVAIDMFHAIIRSDKKGEEFATQLHQLVSEYDTLRLYVNQQMKEIGMTYGLCVQQISANWKNDSSKFNVKGETDKYIEKREVGREARKIKFETERQERMKAQQLAFHAQQAAHQLTADQSV
jgi:hypothetical protein